ncbi:zinc ABC transporter substrate-binding protein AztC [Amycolatopsis sp. NPDC054798]
MTGLRTRASAAFLTVLFLVASCSSAHASRASVVVTTNILGDITRAVVGDQAEVTVLMKPNADPHSFGISAQQAAAVERAGLIVYNGLGLEEGVLRTVRAAEEHGVPALPVGERVNPISHSAGQPDPHFWTDPSRVRDAVTAIADQVVAQVSGVDESAVRAHAEEYRKKISALEDEMRRRFAEIPPQRRKLVTNHHVFGYFAQRFGFEVVGAVIPSGTTLASPSASDLAALAGAVRAAGVPAIFADSSQPDRLAKVLADQAGVRVRVTSLFSESLSEPGQGAPTYLDMMRANTEAIATSLTRP